MHISIEKAINYKHIPLPISFTSGLALAEALSTEAEIYFATLNPLFANIIVLKL